MIDSFRGEYRFLSNFHPVQIEYLGLTFPSVEHAYQAAKIQDENTRLLFTEGTAGEAKKLGKKVKLREDWEEVKLAIMDELLRKKFCKGTALARKLLDTKDEELIEGNYWHDYFWGVCNGKGENHLGKILMWIRKGLKEKK